MHVLSIAPSFSITGVSVHVDDINRHLVATGHSVTLAPLSVDEPRVVRCRPTGDLVQPIELQDQPHDWFAEKLSLADAYVATILAQNEAIDLIHSHDWLAALVGRRLSERTGWPHLTTIHTLAEIQRQRVGLPGQLPVHLGQVELEKELCRGPGSILTVGQSIKELVIEFTDLAPERVGVIPNGVDLRRFSPPPVAAVTDLRRRLAPNGEDLVLFVGRLAPQKGLDFLLRSTYRVRSARPATRWVMVGDHVASYMMKPACDRAIAEGGYGDHLAFEGHVPRDGVLLYYHAADCIVLPSLFESCPYVALEAMAAGTCVIASDLDSLRELIVDHESGLLVPIDGNQAIQGPSVSALAEAQIEVLDSRSLRQTLSKTARDSVAERYPLETQLEAMDALYANLSGSLSATA